VAYAMILIGGPEESLAKSSTNCEHLGFQKFMFASFNAKVVKASGAYVE
jgi:hypothetical protein